MLLMLIGTQISSYLISKDIWESGYTGLPAIPPLALPARDALDIERRSREGVTLRNEERRYTLCCERMQGIARELSLGGAPIPDPFIWASYESEQVENPKAMAWLALSEYFRSKYQINRNGIEKDTLRFDRLEAVFHPPGIKISNLLALFEKIKENPLLDKVFAAIVQQTAVATSKLPVTKEECSAAFEGRCGLLKRCLQESLGIVEVVELV